MEMEVEPIYFSSWELVWRSLTEAALASENSAYIRQWGKEQWAELHPANE